MEIGKKGKDEKKKIILREGRKKFELNFQEKIPLLIEFINEVIKVKDSFDNQDRLAWSLCRYEFFMQLLSDYNASIVPNSSDQTPPLVPPIDVAVIWICHLMAPLSYHRECEEIFGKVFESDRSFLLPQKEKEEGIAHTSRLWDNMMKELEIDDEPYNYSSSSATPDDQPEQIEIKVDVSILPTLLSLWSSFASSVNTSLDSSSSTLTSSDDLHLSEEIIKEKSEDKKVNENEEETPNNEEKEEKKEGGNDENVNSNDNELIEGEKITIEDKVSNEEKNEIEGGVELKSEKGGTELSESSERVNKLSQKMIDLIDQMMEEHYEFFGSSMELKSKSIEQSVVWICHLIHSSTYQRDCANFNHSFSFFDNFPFPDLGDDEQENKVKKWNYLFFEKDVSRGKQGEGDDEYHHPRFLAIHPRFHLAPEYQQIFVCDGHNNRISVVDANINSLKMNVGVKGYLPGQFQYSTGMAVDYQTGCWFCSDLMNSRINIFHADGSIVGSFGELGKPTELPDFHRLPAFDPNMKGRDEVIKLKHPTGVAIHQQSRRMFISDFGNHHLHVFQICDDVSPNPKLSFEIHDIPDSMVMKFRSQENQNKRALSIKYIGRFGQIGVGDYQFSEPNGIEVDQSWELLFITDRANNRVQVFNLDGVFITTIGSKGVEDGKLDGPNGLCVSPFDHHLFICDTTNDRIQIFAPHFPDDKKAMERGEKGEGRLEYRFIRSIGQKSNVTLNRPYGAVIHLSPPSTQVLTIAEYWNHRLHQISFNINKD